MAACRRISTCLMRVSRILTQFERQKCIKTGHKLCFNQKLLLIPNRLCSAAAASQTSELETVLNSGSFDEAMGSINDKTDVYLIGMPHETSKDDIERFFEGLAIEDICDIDTSRSLVKKIYYVRFKDEGSKTEALTKHKSNIGDRYVEVQGTENKDRLGYLLLKKRSKYVELSNLPFVTNPDDIIQWLKPVDILPDDVIFIKRGRCIVHFQQDSDVQKAYEKNRTDLGERKIGVTSFISRDTLQEFREKYYISAAASQTSELETVLNSGSFDEAMGSINDKTDVYLIGMPYETSKDDIERFFEGLALEDICDVDTSRSQVKKIFYFVRFKNEGSKTEALTKHKSNIGDRYVKVLGTENKDPLGYLLLKKRSKYVELSNLPSVSNSDDIIQWLKPVDIRPDDVIFIKRESCIVHFQQESDVQKAYEKNGKYLGGRKIGVTGFISRDTLKEFREKYLV